MVISHNILAMNANRMLNITDVKQKKNTEKLSSGYRINRAADDAAGLAISEKMRRQIRGLTQAAANCQDGISMVQIADGAMEEISAMLHRGTELSVKAANGTLTDEDRSYIQMEIDALKEEITGFTARTTFNEIPLLKGTPVIDTEVKYNGSMPSWASSPSLSDKYLSQKYTDGSGVEHAASYIDLSSFDGSTAQMDELADGNKGFNTTCATCDNHYTINFTADPAKAGSRTSGEHYIITVDISGCTTGSDVADRVIAATGGAPGGHYTQIAKDSSGNLIVYDERNISSITPSQATFKEGTASIKEPEPFDIAIQAGAEGTDDNRIEIQLPTVSLDALGITGTNVRTQANAKVAIGNFKNAISHVSTERSRMGAYQNRLEHTINNLNNVVENTTAAESSIRDTDMAAEMIRFANNNILAQAGQAMLAQANQTKQGVLTLIQ